MVLADFIEHAVLVLSLLGTQQKWTGLGTGPCGISDR